MPPTNVYWETGSCYDVVKHRTLYLNCVDSVGLTAAGEDRELLVLAGLVPHGGLLREGKQTRQQ